VAGKKRFPYRAAVVACNGSCPAQGGHGCAYGCIGCGNCAAVCKFGAVSMNENGTAQVDEEKCIACGMCVRACPKGVIHIHECANYIVVKCSNKDKGKDAKEVCAASCIGCGICEKNCTAEAVKVVENCAVIREDICLSCGMCAVRCPRNVIADVRGILT
jgi:MinD superfamily P-loop ATPase containing an inserted ferredoxin domain